MTVSSGGFHWEGGTRYDGQNIDLESLMREFAGGMGTDPEEFGRRARGRTRRARTVEAEMTIPFLTAALSGTVPLNIDGSEGDLKIPAGVEEGTKMRVQGRGPGGAEADGSCPLGGR